MRILGCQHIIQNNLEQQTAIVLYFSINSFLGLFQVLELKKSNQSIIINKQQRLMLLLRLRKLYPPLTSQLNQYFSKKTISQGAQKALWASRIIDAIITAPPLQDISSLSMKDHVMRIQDPSSQYQFSPSIKEQVFKLFTSGVVLDPEIYKQTRVIQGKQYPRQEQHQKSEFIFCPNYIATKPIFKRLAYLNNKALITGGFGISKSISIILFIQLSNMINGYLYQAEKTLTNRLQYKQLQKLFTRQIPRYWYWSIDSKADYNSDFLQKMLIKQSFQLTSEERQELQNIKNFPKFIQELKSMYPSSIPRKIVVDQINELCSLMRDWNYSKRTPDDQRQYRIPAMDLAKKLRRTIDLSTYRDFVLNSSMTIEDDLLDSAPSTQTLLRLNLQKHQLISREQISLSAAVNKRQGQLDFIHIFWGQIERRLKRHLALKNNEEKTSNKVNISDISDQIQKIKKVYYQLAPSSIEISHFSRAIYARQFFDQIASIEDIKNTQNMSQILKKFDNFCQEQYVKRFEHLFRSDSSKNVKETVLAAIYQIAELQDKQEAEKQKNQQTKILWNTQLKKIEQKIKIYHGDIEDQSIMRELKRNYYKEVLPLQFLKGGIVQFPYTRKQFLRATARILYPDLAITEDQYQANRQSSIFRGIQYERSIIRAITRGTCLRFANFNKRQSFWIQQLTDFLPLNKELDINRQKDSNGQIKNIQTLERNLAQSLEAAVKKPNKIIFGVPKIDGKFIFNNPVFDFILLKYDSTSNKHRLWTIDVTISKKVDKKIKDAKIYYEALNAEDKELFVSIVHIILCPSASFNQQLLNRYSSTAVQIILYENNLFQIEQALSTEKYQKFLKAKTINSRIQLQIEQEKAISN